MTQGADHVPGHERDALLTALERVVPREGRAPDRGREGGLDPERARAADVVADLAGTLRNELHAAAIEYPRAVGT